MNDLSPSRHHLGHGRLSGIDLDDPIHITPPGTPPPPYPQPSPGVDVLSAALNEVRFIFTFINIIYFISSY